MTAAGRAGLTVGIDGRVLCSPQVRGLSRYTVNLLRALSTHRDLDMVVICKGEPYAGHLEGIRARVVVGPLDREWTWHLRTLPALIRRETVDVYHAPADRGLPWRKVCPQVVTVHGSYERAHWRSLHTSVKHRGLYWAHEAANRFRADRVIAVSKTTAEELSRLKVAERSKLRVIPLAAGPEFTSVESPHDTDVLSRLGVKGPYILFVGGYEANKNVETVVAAFDRLSDPSVGLVIAADFQWRFEQLREQWRASVAKFDRMVFVAADQCALPVLYRHASACVVASRWESFGFPVVEAMASGTPVISSCAHALPETGGDAAVYFSPESSAELAELMEQVTRNPALGQRLQDAGMRRSADFSWQRVGDSTAEVYREAAAGATS
jgi:glycosyltransferase involved in cell wall biosynthesis